jgi:hypothetical protein
LSALTASVPRRNPTITGIRPFTAAMISGSASMVERPLSSPRPPGAGDFQSRDISATYLDIFQNTAAILSHASSFVYLGLGRAARPVRWLRLFGGTAK